MDAFTKSEWWDRTLYKFRRHYYHAVRNQKAAGQNPDLRRAYDEALWRTRNEIIPLMHDDKHFEDDFERNEIWTECLLALMTFGRMLMDLKAEPENIGPDNPPLVDELKHGQAGPITVKGVEPIRPYSPLVSDNDNHRSSSYLDDQPGIRPLGENPGSQAETSPRTGKPPPANPKV